MTSTDTVETRFHAPPAGTRPADWVTENAGRLRAELRESGVLRLRGLGDAVAELDRTAGAITGSAPLEYEGGATPRTRLERRVYSSTDFPAEHQIDLHSELAYARTWPRYLAFGCLEAASSGGATPIADTAAIADRVPPGLAERLQRSGIRYRRAFHPMLGRDWRDVYGVADIDELRAVAAQRGERVEIAADGAVATTIDLPAYLEVDGRPVWFNQMVAFNARTLPDDVREDLELVVGAHAIPKDSLAGDGEPFRDSDIRAVREAVSATTVAVPWRAGDLLLIDNRRYAHGREPYTGDRRVRVCMFGADGWPGHEGTDDVDHGGNDG